MFNLVTELVAGSCVLFFFSFRNVDMFSAHTERKKATFQAFKMHDTSNGAALYCVVIHIFYFA